jgi:hypothetical protein
MNKNTLIIFLLHFSSISFGQNTVIKSMIDSLQYINANSLDCSADLYWRIISNGENSIPFLIDKLTDTSSTNIISVCKKTKLNVAEVSYEALTEIGEFPMYLMTHIQFDYFENNGCWSFYTYFYNDRNKKEFKNLVSNWYLKEKNKYKSKRISKNKLSECQKKYGITKFYKWK